MPERLQLSRRRGYRKPEGAVVVARPSRWGNPFAVGQERDVVLFPSSRWVPPLRGTVTPRDRREAVELYRLSVLGEDGRVVFHNPRTPSTAEIRAALAGKDLACWCPLDSACHADVLLEIANVPEDCGACSDCIDRVVSAKPFPDNLEYPFIVCSTCGNKRCPKAQSHKNGCTGSNEPGQPGAIQYPKIARHR